MTREQAPTYICLGTLHAYSNAQNNQLTLRVYPKDGLEAGLQRHGYRHPYRYPYSPPEPSPSPSLSTSSDTGPDCSAVRYCIGMTILFVLLTAGTVLFCLSSVVMISVVYGWAKSSLVF